MQNIALIIVMLYLVVKSKMSGKRASKFIIVIELTVNTEPPVNSVAFGLESDFFSITSETGTSRIEIAEVKAAILKRAKNKIATIIPETPIMSNKIGKTSKIRLSPEVSKPLASNILPP
jgi:hypothetical protein